MSKRTSTTRCSPAFPNRGILSTITTGEALGTISLWMRLRRCASSAGRIPCASTRPTPPRVMSSLILSAYCKRRAVLPNPAGALTTAIPVSRHLRTRSCTNRSLRAENPTGTRQNSFASCWLSRSPTYVLATFTVSPTLAQREPCRFKIRAGY